MPFLNEKQSIAAKVHSCLKCPEISPEEIEKDFTLAPSLEVGFVALPCFRYGKLLKKSPAQIAAQLASQWTDLEYEVSATGPYVNFKWPGKKLFVDLVRAMSEAQKPYGHDTVGEGKKRIVEYCSPNIAKRLAFHHIRSTLIGNTISNVQKALGYDVIRMNFVGDWGSQFARLLAAIELWGDAAFFEDPLVSTPKKMEKLAELYVLFHKEVEENPALNEKISSNLQRLEKKEPQVTRLWETIRKLSIQTMEKTVGRLQTQFDVVEGESLYIEGISKTLEQVKEKAQARMSEGAWVVDIEGMELPALIQKSDGTTLYLTRDIAAAIDRHARFGFEKMIYVVSQQQSLHFKLLFGVLEKMGYAFSRQLEHVAFGTVRFGSQKMSTREGKVFLLEDVLEEAKSRALKICTEKNPQLENKEEVSERVGVGAIIFGELSTSRMRDIDFNWESILAFDGETGPYVQYSVVRCESVLAKQELELKDLLEKAHHLGEVEFNAQETALMWSLSRMREILHQVDRELEPSYLARYLIELTRTFNQFYYQVPILQASDDELRTMRLTLVAMTSHVLRSGLALLGVQCPHRM